MAYQFFHLLVTDFLKIFGVFNDFELFFTFYLFEGKVQFQDFSNFFVLDPNLGVFKI
jgi:hypothetical protein